MLCEARDVTMFTGREEDKGWLSWMSGCKLRVDIDEGQS